MTDTLSPTWTILIPTLGERHEKFRRLMSVLMPQVDAAGGQVKVLARWNEGTPGLPQIRQELVEAAATDYVSFIDDDDMVPGDFVPTVLAALDEQPDYVGWQVQYFADGKLSGVADHSLRHGQWREEMKPYRLLRDISHINPMRTEIARLADFRTVPAGQVEDRPWVAQIRATGALKTEVYIPRVMYHYFWSRRGSRWQRPDQIRRTGHRVEIDSPNFSYFSPEPKRAPAGARLGVIIPTRGRPDNIAKVIDAWDATGAWSDADMILAIDADDPEIDSYRQFELRVKTAEIGAWTPMVPKLNRVALAAAKGADYFALAFAGDDHLPRTDGWARRYLDVLGEMGTGMVYGDDGYQGANLSTEWAVTADAVRALGRMVPAPVDHLYCDNAMMDLFGQAGALRHLADVKIEHMHPVAGKSTEDAQYARVNSHEQNNSDRRAYNRWQRTEMASQVAIIRGLRGEAPRPTVSTRRPNTGTHRGWGSAVKNVKRSGPSARRTSLAPKAFQYVQGATPDEIGITLADLARQVPADQAIVELGVFQGRTALLMAWGAGQGNGAHVYGIDMWDLPGNVYDPPFTDPGTRARAYSNIEVTGYTDHVTLIQGHSLDVVTTWTDNPRVGLLFVDGDHTKAGARRDIEAWAPYLADGAVIAIDDYGHPDWPGVGEAVDELVAESFLAPIELYHDRLAVTRLASDPKPGGATAITSEGIEPAPEDTRGPTLGELRRRARDRKIAGASKMSEAQLIAALGTGGEA
jgi:predicted O-methyltransferase YrrM